MLSISVREKMFDTIAGAATKAPIIVAQTAVIGFIKQSCLPSARERFGGTASFSQRHVVQNDLLLALKKPRKQ
jgi:hypothetical protein